MKDYMVYSDDDPSIPEEFYTRKRDAIRAAKEMARESGEDAMVLPCIDGYANDFAPHYIVTPQGEVIERKWK